MYKKIPNYPPGRVAGTGRAAFLRCGVSAALAARPSVRRQRVRPGAISGRFAGFREVLFPWGRFLGGCPEWRRAAVCLSGLRVCRGSVSVRTAGCFFVGRRVCPGRQVTSASPGHKKTARRSLFGPLLVDAAAMPTRPARQAARRESRPAEWRAPDRRYAPGAPWHLSKSPGCSRQRGPCPWPA